MTAPTPAAAPRPTARLWLYRALAGVGLPALLVLALEGGLRLAGYGRPATFLIPDAQPGFLRSNPDFAGLFLPRNFDLRPLNFRIAARKPAHTVRVVLLGESAAQGVPVPAFGLAPQLRAQLRARYPGRDIEVINTGIVAVNSHVIYQIAREMADHDPDLFVVYAGNNEVVGPYGPGCAYLSDMPPLPVIRLSGFVRASRIGQALGALMGRISARRGPPLEWGGMAMFVNQAVRGDDPRLEAVYRNFAANLRDVVRVATGAGAKVVLSTAVANLKDCAPLLSLHRPGLAGAEQAAWQQAFDRGRLEWLLDDPVAARRDLAEALRLDPQYADTAFLLGALELRTNEPAAARRHLVDALHWDALRFRPDPRINAAIREVARSSPAGVTLVDAAVLLGADGESSAPPAGRELLFEHVHFNFDGNHQLARLLAQGVEQALGADATGRAPWLDSACAAAAVGYTAHAQVNLLQRVADIVRKPPFTNQLTYLEDQAALAREIARAETTAAAPETLRRASADLQRAIAADPANPALAGLAQAVELEAGNLEAALVQARRARDLLPADLSVVADEVSLLTQLGRFDEAKARLAEAEQASREPEKLAPNWAALYTRQQRPDEARRQLDRALARRPADPRLRLMRANLARLAGDTAAAERDLRAILADTPGDEGALEALVSLLTALGQPAAIERLSRDLAEHQTRNQLNDLRVAGLAEARGDDAEAGRYLRAATQCGPANSAILLRLARKLYHLQRGDEMQLCLAHARRLAAIEDDGESAAAIDQLIGRLRPEAR